MPRVVMMGNSRLEPYDATHYKMFFSAYFLDDDGLGREHPVEVLLGTTDSEGTIQDAINTALIDTGTILGVTVATTDISKTGSHRGGQMEFLGSTVITSDQNTTSTVTIPARDFLTVMFRLNGMDVTSTLALRLNGDTGSNYSSRFLFAAAGGTTWTNVETLSTSFARISPGNSLAGRSGTVHISNRALYDKKGYVSYFTQGGAPVGVPAIGFGGFEWDNSTDSITSIVMLAVDAGSKMLSGSGFAVLGGNF